MELAHTARQPDRLIGARARRRERLREDAGRAPGMERRVVDQGLVRRDTEAETAGQELHEALDVVEVRGPNRLGPVARARGAGPCDAEAPPFRGPRVGLPVALAGLEDRHVDGPAPAIRVDDAEQAREQPLAEHGVLGRERVGHADRASRRRRLADREQAVGGDRQALEIVRRHQRVGQDLVQPGTGERRADDVPDLERRRAVPGHRRVRRHGRDRLVAAEARDLLGDVRLDLEVATPARHDRRRGILARRHVQARDPARHRDRRPGSGLRCDPHQAEPA